MGATRHCDLLPMGSVEERIFDWKEGEEYSLEILEGKKIAPFKFARARIVLNSEGNQIVVTTVFALVIDTAAVC